MNVLARVGGKLKELALGSAATRNVGTSAEEMLEAGNAFLATFSSNPVYLSGSEDYDCNTFALGSKYLVAANVAKNTPPVYDSESHYYIETRQNYTANARLQIAYGYKKANIFIRTWAYGPNSYGAWRRIAMSDELIQKKTLTATYPAASQITLAHGLSVSKIRAIHVTAKKSNGAIMPPNSIANHEYYWYYNSTYVVIVRSAANDSSLAGSTLQVIIEYEL